MSIVTQCACGGELGPRMKDKYDEADDVWTYFRVCTKCGASYLMSENAEDYTLHTSDNQLSLFGGNDGDN